MARSYIYPLAAGLAAATAYLADAFRDLAAAVRDVTDEIINFFLDIWPDFRPDADTSLLLDAAVHAGDDSSMVVRMQRALAFLRRGLTHARYVADGYLDPGWRAAT